MAGGAASAEIGLKGYGKDMGGGEGSYNSVL